MSLSIANAESILTLGAVGIERLGVLMELDPDVVEEEEGVLNPGSARTRDGTVMLFPRLVARGNFSRIGRAEVILDDGVPVGVSRQGIALAPDEPWERGNRHGGVEDPRITWIPTLGQHVMTYVAFGPLGPRPALAVSADAISWRRLGPLHFAYEELWHANLNLFPNKDVVFFPDVVPGPDGQPSYALLHRPVWDLTFGGVDELATPPDGVTDPRPSIWISYIPVGAVLADLSALARPRCHRQLALPEYDWEALKIGAGPPPIRTDAGWLVIHHGVSGDMVGGAFDLQQKTRYVAGAMLLSLDEPGRIVARTSDPIMVPETSDEQSGTVANVVFPTAVETIDDQMYLFYGMADAKIGVARVLLNL